MEAQAIDLHAVLESQHVSMDTKINYLTSLKSEIKHRQVPAVAIPPIFDVVRSAINSRSTTLQASGFSTLSHLIKRLYLQEQADLIAAQGSDTFPILTACLGDAKERVRLQAAQAFTDFWHASPGDVEHYVLSIAMNDNPRAKETSMQWLVKMNKENGVLIKPHIPKVVDCLEDADVGVRETAKATLVELFHDVPDHAKADLRRQLQIRNIRKMIVSSILTQLGMSAPAGTETREHHPRPMSRGDHRKKMATGRISRPGSAMSYHGHDDNPLKSSTQSFTPKGPSHSSTKAINSGSTSELSLADASNDNIEPLNIYTNREVDELFHDMLPHFEGRESEQNWLAREKSTMRLRRLTKGNAPTEFFSTYSAGIKTLLDGILKVANSLRTTLSTSGCYLVQEIARTSPASLEPMAELMLLNFIKVCAATKKISAQNGNVTVDALLGNLSYHTRLLQHVWGACQEKNVQPRLYAPGWIKTLITKHLHHKSMIEHSGGVELLEKCLNKGLGDANPGVRQNMREAFWVFAKAWPLRAETLISKLDAKSQDRLRKDPGNTNELHFPSDIPSSSSVRPSTFSRSTTSVPGRPTLKETIAAQKRAKLAAKGVPDRPESAQSSYSLSAARPAMFSAKTKSATNLHPQSGSLSSAPVRPMRPPRRPELNRPATAEPYAARNAMRSGTPTSSPKITPVKAKGRTPVASKPPSPEKERNSKPESTTSSPMKSKLSTMDTMSPTLKATTSAPDVPTIGSPTKTDEELTMLVPTFKNLTTEQPAIPREASVSEIDPHELDATTEQNRKVPPTGGDILVGTETLKVYEDPVPLSNEIEGNATSPTKKSTALEELTINEPLNSPIDANNPSNGMPISPLNQNGMRSLNENTPHNVKAIGTPEHRSPSPKKSGGRESQMMLASGIKKIKARTIDVHGFRKIQGLIKANKDLFEDVTQYDSLLLASLDALEEPIDESRASSGRDQDLKTQILGTIRVMHNHDSERFSRFYPRALGALLKARRNYTIRNHLVSGLEQALDMIVEHCKEPNDCIKAVLGLLQREESVKDEQSRRTLAMGLYCLAGLLHRMNEQGFELPEVEQETLGKMARQCLEETDSDIRRAVIDYAMEVHDQVQPSEKFWAMLNNEVAHRDLLTYYLGRRAQKRGR
ncbi:MAG: suppressor of tub2 mutation [Cirrosporium novae-zelandiae]|nr:MAG: suppressor of tub2 mutation [Cirrosporium novae-zelandiae]